MKMPIDGCPQLLPQLLQPLLVLIALPIIFQIGGAQAGGDVVDAKDSKAVIQKATTSLICDDKLFLDSVNLDGTLCRSEVARYAAPCWQMLDTLLSGHKIVQGSEGFEIFSSAADLYTHCIQAKLIMSELNIRMLEKNVLKCD